MKINAQFIRELITLTALPGIGAPVGSTILHFIFPDIFPIYDRRTVHVLLEFGYLRQKTINVRNYRKFREVLLELRDELGRYSLREIDRALFAFHKIELEKKGRSE